MRLLVVTPTLGRSPWLSETVASVAAHAPGAVHLLVAPREKLAELGAAYPSVRLVADPGGGMYAAINAGLAADAEWEAFTYINDDDVLRAGFADVRERLGAMAGAAMIYGGVGLIDADGRGLGGIAISTAPERNRALYAERLEPVYQHGTVITRGAWERVGPFDERYRFCGDSDYLARLCLGGVWAEFVRGEAAAFRLRPGQLTQDREAMRRERGEVDTRLGLLVGVGRVERLRARLGFRWANRRLYWARVRRHGLKRFDEVIVAVGQR